MAFCGAAFATSLTSEVGRINNVVVGENPTPSDFGCQIIDDGVFGNAWGWLEGYEYHIAASHFMEFGGTIDSAKITMTDWRFSVNHNFDMNIWEDADNDGAPDNIIYTEYMDVAIGDYPDLTDVWIYPNIVVAEAWYWIGYTSRNQTFQGIVIDGVEDFPAQNWYWDGTGWYSGNLYPGDDFAWICYSGEMTGVSIDITPNDPPILIPQEGGTFSFDGVVQNGVDPATWDIWSYAMVPDIGYYGPLRLYNDVPFAGNESRERTGIPHGVPGCAPEGSYTYVACVGDYDAGTVEDSSYFTFYKQGAGGGPYSVIICLADYAGDEWAVRDALLADPRILSVDVFDARSSTPTLGELTPYDVVVTWTNYTYFDNVAMGDVLADFADAGGGVVACMFAFYGPTGWEMSGRWMAEYSPFGISPTGFVDVSMSWYDAGHPIMAGASTASDYFVCDAPLTGDAYLIAEWDNGYPCVAENSLAPRCIGFNGYYGATNGRHGGDFMAMLVNAVAYSGDNTLAISGGNNETIDNIPNPTPVVNAMPSTPVTER